MKLLASSLVVLSAMIATTAGARADRPLRERVPVTEANASLSFPARQRYQARTVPAEPSSRLIYLNRCVGGCSIFAGAENSRTNRSTVARRNSMVPAFTHGDAIWNRTVACVKETYGRFNIAVTDVDPCTSTTGCTTPHWEVIVAGVAADIGYVSQSPGAVGGVSPFDFRSCNIIDNSITYAFAGTLGADVDELCWTIAQETAHSFGLDHELLGEDPMTYLPAPSKKRFQDTLADCGESTVRNCYCRTKQNSVTELMAIFGAAPPSPPTIEIVSPRPGDAVEPGFVVSTQIIDDQGIAKVELLVDNQIAQTLTAGPFAFNAPATLGAGSHRVEVRAVDANGTPGTASVDVYIGAPCQRPGDCAAVGDDYTCVGGRCVPGPGAPGGLGESCGSPLECSSGLCVGSEGVNSCTEQCMPGVANQCPDSFACANGTDGVGYCIAGETSGGCLGCSTGSGTSPIAPIGAGLAVAGLLLRRRRKPSARPH